MQQKPKGMGPWAWTRRILSGSCYGKEVEVTKCCRARACTGQKGPGWSNGLRGVSWVHGGDMASSGRQECRRSTRNSWFPLKTLAAIAVLIDRKQQVAYEMSQGGGETARSRHGAFHFTASIGAGGTAVGMKASIPIGQHCQ